MTRWRIREPDFDKRIRNVVDAQGRPAMGGMSRVGAASRSRGAGSLIAEGRDETAQTTGAAQLLVMSATGDSIASGGDYVEFDTIIAQYGFAGVVQPAGDSWVHPTTGVYVFPYEHAWDSYLAGGTIEVEVDGTVALERVIASGVSGQRGSGTIAYFAEAGTVGKVKVTQTSGSAQTCSARMHLAITDPVPDSSVSWTQVFSGDAWGITHDGSSWWITEGISGNTVSSYDSGWTLTGSFEADMSGNRVRGITFDGTDLWLTGNDPPGAGSDLVHRHNTAGTHVTEWAVPDSAVSGIAWDGSSLWVVGATAGTVFNYNTAGTQLSSWSLPTGSWAGALFHAGLVWVVDTETARVVKFTTAGEVAGEIDLSGATATPTGIFIKGRQLYVSEDGVGVWQSVDPVT